MTLDEKRQEIHDELRKAEMIVLRLQGALQVIDELVESGDQNGKSDNE